MMKDLHVLLVLLAFVVTIHGFTRFKDSHRRSIFKGPLIKDRFSAKHHNYDEDTGRPSTYIKLPELSISSQPPPSVTSTTERPNETTTVPARSQQFRHKRSWDSVFKALGLPPLSLIKAEPGYWAAGEMTACPYNTKPKTLAKTTTTAKPTKPTTRPTTKPTSTTPVPTTTKLPHETTTIHCYQLLQERYTFIFIIFWDLFFNDSPIRRLQAERTLIRFFSESSPLTTTPTQKTTQFPLKRVDFLSRIKRSSFDLSRELDNCVRNSHMYSYVRCIKNVERYARYYYPPNFDDRILPLVSSLELTTTTSTPKPTTTTTTTSKPKPTTTTTKLPQETTPVQPESFKSNRALECYDLLGERYPFLADIFWNMAVNASKYYYDEYYDESSLSDTLIQSNQNTQIPTTTSFPKTPTATPTTKFTLHNTEAASVPQTPVTETSTIVTTVQPATKPATTLTPATSKSPTTIKLITTPATKPTLTTATTPPTTSTTTPTTTSTTTPTTTPPTTLTTTPPTTSTTTPTTTSTTTPTTTSTTTPPTTLSITTEECPETTTIQCYNLLSELYPVLANNLRDVFFNDSQIVRQQAEKEIIQLLNDSSIKINQIPPIKMPEDTDTFQQEWPLSCKVVDCYNLLIEGYPFLEDMLWGMVMELEKSYSNDNINFHLYANDNHDNATNTKHENAT